MKITDCKIGKKYQIDALGIIGTLMKNENGLGWDIEKNNPYKKDSDGLVRFGTGIDNKGEDLYEDYKEIEELQAQIKQSYSKEEVFTLLTNLINSDFIDFTKEYGIKGWDELTKWFEQFKKK